MAVHVMVMAGGSGARFWPRSRRLLPKQLLRITARRSMLQETVRRVQSIAPGRLMVVTNHMQVEATRAQLAALSVTDGVAMARVVAEPASRNTAPAVALAAALITREDPGGTMIVLPADHHIEKGEVFRDLLRVAIDAADAGSLVTLGVTPTRAETGYGYIALGEEIAPGVRRVEAFWEKPDTATAARYLASGRHLWNSGMFVWKTSAILDALAQHMPALHRLTRKVVEASTAALETAIGEMFALAESRSIDYGVMEKHRDVVALPADIGWSDVGSWASLAELRDADERGNTVEGDVVVVDSDGCYVQAGQRTIAILGVRDLVVVETEDAVLVCPRERAQDVRKIVATLAAQGREELL